jgi:hypothetical protein
MHFARLARATAVVGLATLARLFEQIYGYASTIL